MSYKKMLILLLSVMLVIILCLLGASYAYYSLSNASTSFNTTTAEDNGIAVVYEQSENINISTGIPITDDEISEKAASSKFSALAPSDTLLGYQVAIQIDLVDISIADALKISDFKVQLLENGTVIATKTGANIGSNTSINLKSMSTITVGTTYNYELRIWVHETGVSQNTLMNKSFSGRIEVSSAMKKH